jgi:TolB-like protein
MTDEKIFLHIISKGGLKMRISFIFYLLLSIILFFFSPKITSAGGPAWFDHYKSGQNAMDRADWNAALASFQQAVQTQNKDSGKLRAVGTIFIEYYPHREMGICYFQLGDLEKARQELTLSLQQSSSRRAEIYLDAVNKGQIPPQSTTIQPTPPPETATLPGATVTTSNIPEASSEIVGDRLSIAVLPFESKGLGNDLGSIDLLDKLITGFVNINRFKVIERALLEKILEEQKLGMSGIVDASTAAEIGKGIGVDAVVVGSVTRGTGALSIDARLIDTETAQIVTAKDAYSANISFQEISQMITQLAEKIKAELPVVNGYVIGTSDDQVTVDIGRANNIKKGMKCIVYREGAPIVHPVTGKVIAREIDELCEIQITEVFDVYSIGKIIKMKKDVPKIRDKIVTK